jgi:hypothetical protein
MRILNVTEVQFELREGLYDRFSPTQEAVPR